MAGQIGPRGGPFINKGGSATWHMGPPFGLIDDMSSKLMQARCGEEGPWNFRIDVLTGISIKNVCAECQMQAGVRF